MWIAIMSIVALGVAAFGGNVMDYFHDFFDAHGRAKQITRWSLLIATAISVPLGTCAACKAEKEAKEDKTVLMAKLDHLQEQNDRLIRMIGPVLDEAKRRHPAAATDEEALALFRADLLQIKRDTDGLRKQMERRKLEPEQRVAIVKHLSSLKGQSVRVVKLGDDEAARYADDLIAAIEESGVSVQVVKVGLMSQPTYGLKCDSSPVAQALMEALAPTDDRCELLPSSGLGSIVVGLKPSP